MTEILFQAIAGLLLGGSCGYFVAIKALPFIPRDSNGATVGFDLDAIAFGFIVLSLGILGGAVIGLFTAHYGLLRELLENSFPKEFRVQ